MSELCSPRCGSNYFSDCIEYILYSFPHIRILKTVTLTDFNTYILETMSHNVVNKCDRRYTIYDFTNSCKGSEMVRGRVSLAVIIQKYPLDIILCK